MDHIALFIPSLAGGGAERVFLQLANSLTEQIPRVDLVLMTRTGPYLRSVNKAVQLFDLKCPRLWTSLPAFHAYVRSETPHLIISAMPLANGIAIAAVHGMPARVRPTVIITVHNQFSLVNTQHPRLAYRFLGRVIRWLYQKADGIVAVSRGVKSEVCKLPGMGKRRIRVVHNPVDVDRIGSACERISEGRTPVNTDSSAAIVTAGRLEPQKDHETLLKAFAMVIEDIDAQLVILGEGKESAKLKSISSDLQLGNQVKFVGWQVNPFRFMKAADVFVLSSRYEGFGLVLLEAMACGTPVVSTDCPSGPAEILEGGRYGRLVPVGDAKALAEAIIATYDAPVKKGDELVRRAREFSPHAAASQYLAYAETLSEQR